MKNLFKSQTAYEILELLSTNPDYGFSLPEVRKQVKKDAANVVRELGKLVKEGIVDQQTKDRKKTYRFNKDYSLGPELISLLQKNKAAAIEPRFKREWLLAEEIMNANPWFMAIPFYCFTNQFAAPGGRAYQHQACVYKDYHLWFYFDKQDAYEVGEHLVNKFEGDIDFMEEVNTQIRSFADKLVATVDKIPESNLHKLSADKLWQYYQEHESVHHEYYQWGWIPVAADMFGDNLTNRGKQILAGLRVSADKIEEYLALLTQPDKASLLKEEQDNLVNIGIQVQFNAQQFELFKELFRKFKEEDVKFFGLYTHSEEYEIKFEEAVRAIKKKIDPKILDALQKHYAKYFYTKFIYTEEQGVYSFEHYLKELVRLVNGDYNLAATQQKQEEGIADMLRQKRTLAERLKLPEKISRFFNAWGDFMVTKIYRRYAQLFALYKTTYILEEIARRLGLTIKEVRFMTSREIKAALFDHKLDKEEVKSRVKLSVYYTAKDTEIYYSGSIAQEIVVKYIQKETDQNVAELKGQCGCRGQAKGRVCIVNVISDMAKMQNGDILVSISTQPDLLPAMKKAAAFVTDQGGVTSHAAIVAREMNTPCVIATKIATQVLHDGDLVEVDADKGIVKIIKA
ncbi:MAG: PEP-utilizing enzyme [Patescibacteria group bacterium]